LLLCHSFLIVFDFADMKNAEVKSKLPKKNFTLMCIRSCCFLSHLVKRWYHILPCYAILPWFWIRWCQAVSFLFCFQSRSSFGQCWVFLAPRRDTGSQSSRTPRFVAFLSLFEWHWQLYPLLITETCTASRSWCSIYRPRSNGTLSHPRDCVSGRKLGPLASERSVLPLGHLHPLLLLLISFYSYSKYNQTQLFEY